jgi:hypothetical protein
MRTSNFTLATAFGISLALTSHGATLIHHYQFGADGADLLGGANAALLNGAHVTDGFLVLDGSDDYAQVGQHIVPTSGSYSVALFARQSVPQNSYVEFISQGFSTGPGFYLGHDPNGLLRVSDSWQPRPGVPVPADGEWHHYAVTVNASANISRLFIDGVLRAATSGAIATTAAGDHTRFGRQFTPFSEFLNGSLDEIRIYDGELTPEEVATLSGRIQLTIQVAVVDVCWNTDSNSLYRVQYRSELTTNQWVDLGAPIPGSGSRNCILDAVTSPRRFYRVVTVP